MSIIKPKDFNVEKINYVGPRVNDYGGKNVYLNYDANDSSDDSKSKSLILKTPLMPMPYKISRYESESGDYVKYTVDVSFRNKATEEEVPGLEKQVSKLLKKLSSMAGKTDTDEYAELKKEKMDLQERLDKFYLYKAMSGIDDSLVEQGVKKSVAWFKKKKQSADVTRALLQPNVRVSYDKTTGEPLDYPPTIKIRIPFRDGRVNCKVWGTDKKLMDITSETVESVFQQGTKLALLIRCNSVWFAGGKFGCSWQAVQMKVVPNQRFVPVPLAPSSMEIEKVSFSDISSNSYGSKFAWVNYDNNKFLIDVPEMNVPFGLNKYVPAGEDGGNAKYSIEPDFRKADEDEETAALLNFFEKMDEKLVEEGCANSLAWFKKAKQSEDVTRAFLQSSLRYSVDRKTGERLDYAPRFKVKVPCWNGAFSCDFLDADDNKIEGLNEENVVDHVPKGSKVSMVIRPSTLWFAGGKFGISWQATKIKVFTSRTDDEYHFGSDEDEIAIEVPEASDSDEDDGPPPELDEPEEEEEEEEGESEDELEPVVVEKPKKAPRKRGRKKKTT